jgi:hypothetical protein
LDELLFLESHHMIMHCRKHSKTQAGYSNFGFDHKLVGGDEPFLKGGVVDKDLYLRFTDE